MLKISQLTDAKHGVFDMKDGSYTGIMTENIDLLLKMVNAYNNEFLKNYSYKG